MTRSPILLVHGGAWDIPADALEAHEQGVFDALQAGWSLLERGGSAVDAIEAAVTSMEDDPAFDAGRGSFLTRDGRVQLDALIMDGATLRAGGVACVERIRNPIQAARLVLDKSHHVYFVAQGAERFAASHGLPLIDNSELVLDRERERLAEAQRLERSGVPDATFTGSPSQESHDTVGAIALDAQGRLAAATSTGGTLNKAPGRVGDSSLIGCGCYADNASAAVSLTGWGEPQTPSPICIDASAATAASSCSPPTAAMVSPTIRRAWPGASIPPMALASALSSVMANPMNASPDHCSCPQDSHLPRRGRGTS
jgi:beta-aspartyl-peptidase (threonine type)